MSAVIERAGSDVAVSKREKIDAIEAFAHALPDELKVEPETGHYFANHVYGRTMPMRRGEVVIGKRHKHECISVVAKGHIRVVNDADDTDYTDHEAGDVFIAPAGTRRALFAIEDSLFITFHPLDPMPESEIEGHIVMEESE